MLICGVKVTHDAAVAVIDTEARKLLFCVEMEKVDNGPRYAKMPRPAEQIAAVFAAEGMPLECIDAWALDGWKRGRIGGHELPAERYHEFDVPDGARPDDSLLSTSVGGWIDFGNGAVPYTSYKHMAGHVIGSYVASHAARAAEPAYVLTWDGGQNPRMYYVAPRSRHPVQFKRALFEFYGIIYGIMGYYFGPYAKPEVAALPNAALLAEPYFGGYETPGKLMSFIALGRPNDGLIERLYTTYSELTAQLRGNRLQFHQDGIFEHTFMRRAREHAAALGVDDASALHSIHTFLGRMLVAAATTVAPFGSHLIFTGGSALNIKWNSALRSSGHFASVWVPPFPNDSGSALGAAACAAVRQTGMWQMDWSVYCGPHLTPNAPRLRGKECSEEDLATMLAHNPALVVAVLTGRAELGPRALGHRSLLASATLPENKARLNAIKNRESFRPVAPLCMRRHAPRWFTPGTEDPYMLFDHQVRAEVRDLVPAIVHLDGSARLQTLDPADCPRVYRVLEKYHALTGIPMLCNTSANLNGKGFFPDVESALRWNGADFVWSEGRLYSRKDLK